MEMARYMRFNISLLDFHFDRKSSMRVVGNFTDEKRRKIVIFLLLNRMNFIFERRYLRGFFKQYKKK